MATPIRAGDQPDKILYEKATKEIDHGRFDVGRLTLQTLINTYPDSEYLAKAKLAIADSYYSEGGTSGLTQAEAEYKDFITFFPTAPEAPMAQFRAGMAHYRLMGKPDRDLTETRLAEAELKEFLLKYPDSPLVPRVKARLREVQEVLAQGEYKVARYYYERRAYFAAKSRFQDIVDHYPNFSRGDDALWSLAQSYERLKYPKGAVPYYRLIVTEFPLSDLVPDAKARLIAFHQPIPRPTRATLARARADEAQHIHRDLFQRVGGMMGSAPDTTMTLHGPVRLGERQPSGVEVAKTPASSAPGNNIVVQPVGDSSLNAGKPVDSKPSGGTAASANNSQKPADSAKKGDSSPTVTSTGDAPDEVPHRKKKGRFKKLKKIIKPF